MRGEMMCLDQGQKFLLPKRTKQHVVRLACMASSLNSDWNVRKTYNPSFKPMNHCCPCYRTLIASM
jgi:hypothetical protein